MHSSYYSFLLLTIFLFLLPSLIQSQMCQRNCGKQPLKYPFGGGPGCGDPRFQPHITCNQQKLTFTTHTGSYPITSIDYTNQIIHISDPTMSTCSCTQPSKGFGLDWNAPFSFDDSTIFALVDCSMNSSSICKSRSYDDGNNAKLQCDQNTQICDVMYSCRPISSTINLPISTCCVYTPVNLGPSFEMDLEKLQCSSYTGFYNYNDQQVDPEKWNYGIALKYKFSVTDDFPSSCEACERSYGFCGYSEAYNSFLCNCLIFGSIHFFLSQLPNFNSVASVSLAAAVMSLSYSTIAWVACLSRGRIENVSYSYKQTSTSDLIFRIFNALGQISFAFAGHAVALEIQATIPSTPEKPSRIPMWKGAIGAYIINAVCYFPVALIGYWAFGRDVDDNVLMSLERPAWLIASANLMVFIHVVGSYQVYAMPVFDLIETMMIKSWNFPPGLPLRLVARSSFVAFTLIIGVTFPFFGDLLGFFGGFGFAPTSYFLPSIMWLIIKKPKRFSINWFINWAAICIGVCIMLASTVGGFRNIIADASTYKFYT